MPPDVAQGQRAQHRIAQRVDGHIAIGMRQQALVVGDAHTCQDHVVALTEGMDIESGTDAGVAISHGTLPNAKG